MRVKARCPSCARLHYRTIREDGTVMPCRRCGGVMVKTDRSGDKRVAVAKADLQHFDRDGASA